MRILTSSLLFLFISFFTTHAQQTSGIGKSDGEAKKILDQVSTKFKTYKSVQADFSLKLENSAGKLMETKSGKVYMKSTKYRVSIKGQEIFSDGSNTWSYDKASNEVTINKIDPSTNTITPQKLFTNFYDKDFLYKYNGEVKEGSKKVKEIELTPTNKSKSFFKVILHIENNNIVSTKIFETSGNRITYTVSSMSTGTTIPDATFIFNPKNYPGVETVDLR
jgi:outer membrane lipoprotein-sorting protein